MSRATSLHDGETVGARRRRGWLAGLLRAGGFALNLGLLAVLSLIMIPLLIGSSSAAGWGAIAFGQAIGLVASVVLAYGWGFHGPALVARNRYSASAISVEILESVKLRLTLLVPVGVVGGCVAWMVAPGQSVLSLAGYASMVTLGLRMNWLFVGLKSPTLLFLLETLPRIGGLAIAASGLLWLGWGSVAALYVVAASNALSMPLTLLWARARHTFRGLRLRTVRALASAHWHGVVGLTTSALWSTAPTYAVAWLAPSALPAFALAMRVYAQANTASSPAIDVLQGWVPADDYATTRKRAMRALAVSAVLAAIGFGIYFLVAPYLFAFLGAGQVVISPVEQLLLGVALVLSVIVQTTNRACLAALGLAGRFSAIVVIGSLSGLCALFLLIPALGAVGGLLAVITSLLVQAVLGVYITVRPPRSVAGRQRTAQP